VHEFNLHFLFQMLGILEKALMQLEKGLSKSCLFDEFAKFVLSFGSQAKGSSDRLELSFLF